MLDSSELLALLCTVVRNPTTWPVPEQFADWTYPCLESLVLAHGRAYDRAPFPADLERPAGEPGRCYAWAAALAERYGLVYVEGFVMTADLAPLALEHAWCVREGSSDAIDARLPDGTAAAYLGVPFTAAFRLAQQRRRGTRSVIWADTDTLLPDIDVLRDGLPTGAVAGHVGTEVPAP